MSSVNNKSEMKSDDEIKLETPVTTVIRQRPQPDAVSRYEDWLKEIIPVAQQFTGHQGVNVIRPQVASDAYTIVLHFDTMANLRQWLASEVRMRLVDKIRPFLRSEENIDIKTGFEFWFTPPPYGKPAKPYKQFLVTLSAIFPLTIVVPWLLQPIFAWLPVLALPVLRHFVIAAAIVAIMTYAVMPRYTRLVSRWLYG
jgi:antibiotic biosynthesis monooxygenase (ABM) superfamily enzyme